MQEDQNKEVSMELDSLNDAVLFDVEELEQRLELAATVDALCQGNISIGQGCGGNINW